MTLCTSFKVGSLSCHLIEGGTQQLDGGAMFGVVPKPLWQKRIAPDERNRIPLALRCLVVEHPDGLILVDTGVGNKEDEKFHDIYGIENAGIEGATQLEDALAQAGHSPDDVRWVVNTHLHFDHGGGWRFPMLPTWCSGGSWSLRGGIMRGSGLVIFRTTLSRWMRRGSGGWWRGRRSWCRGSGWCLRRGIRRTISR